MRQVVQAYLAGDMATEAVRAAKEGVTAIQNYGDKAIEAVALKIALDAYFANNDFVGAMRSAKACVELLRDLGRQVAEGKMLRRIGEMYQLASQPDEAVPMLKEAVACFQAAEEENEEAATMRMLGHVFSAMGEPEKAPQRGEALELLDEAARAVEVRDGYSFKEAMRKLNNTGGYTQADVDKSLELALVNDKEGAQRFLKAQAGTLDQPPPSYAKQAEHVHIYYMFRSGVNYGPRYRVMTNGYGKRDGDGTEGISAIKVADCSDGWELTVCLPHPVLDTALQTGSLVGYANVPGNPLNDSSPWQ